MKTILSAALTATMLLAPPTRAQSLGKPPPELEAVKWYNTPALALESLRGKTILVEVFRTW